MSPERVGFPHRFRDYLMRREALVDHHDGHYKKGDAVYVDLRPLTSGTHAEDIGIRDFCGTAYVQDIADSEKAIRFDFPPERWADVGLHAPSRTEVPA